MKNYKPQNPNRARRVPNNCCLLCGAALGNFHPIGKQVHKLKDYDTGKLVGWGCNRCCAENPLDEAS